MRSNRFSCLTTFRGTIILIGVRKHLRRSIVSTGCLSSNFNFIHISKQRFQNSVETSHNARWGTVAIKSHKRIVNLDAVSSWLSVSFSRMNTLSFPSLTPLPSFSSYFVTYVPPSGSMAGSHSSPLLVSFLFYCLNGLTVFQWIVFIEHVGGVTCPYFSPTVRSNVIHCIVGKECRRNKGEKESKYVRE